MCACGGAITLPNSCCDSVRTSKRVQSMRVYTRALSDDGGTLPAVLLLGA